MTLFQTMWREVFRKKKYPYPMSRHLRRGIAVREIREMKAARGRKSAAVERARVIEQNRRRANEITT